MGAGDQGRLAVGGDRRLDRFDERGEERVRNGLDDQADLLQRTLDEEGETDHLLTALAESGINLAAEV